MTVRPANAKAARYPLRPARRATTTAAAAHCRGAVRLSRRFGPSVTSQSVTAFLMDLAPFFAALPLAYSLFLSLLLQTELARDRIRRIDDNDSTYMSKPRLNNSLFVLY